MKGLRGVYWSQAFESSNKKRWEEHSHTPSSSFLPLPLPPHCGTTSTQQGLSRALSCLREWFHVNAHLSAANKTRSWGCMRASRAGIVGVGKVGSGERRAENRLRGELTSHHGDLSSSHQTAHWFQMLNSCCRDTYPHTHTYMRATSHWCSTSPLPQVITDLWPLQCCSSQMIDRFGAELESPLA